MPSIPGEPARHGVGAGGGRATRVGHARAAGGGARRRPRRAPRLASAHRACQVHIPPVNKPRFTGGQRWRPIGLVRSIFQLVPLNYATLTSDTI